ncbi:MAG: hypothetical protein WCL06_08375 [Bacteroidota bacterium]
MKKTFNYSLMVLLIITVISCKKKTDNPDDQRPADNYTSMANFHAVNASRLLTYDIDGANGGTFTTPNGTIVIIPANAFVTQGGTPVVGNISIQFKDIYKQSEMLLNDISTNFLYGGPIKSAGMFFIKATKGSQTLDLATGSKITVKQPLNGLPIDTAMVPLILQLNVPTGGPLANGWAPQIIDSLNWAQDSLYWYPGNYIFSLYQFSSPIDSGTWCNSDNPNFFSAYPQTHLILIPNDSISDYYTEMYLLFSNVNSMVHVYHYNNKFNYFYAPVGLQCTAVAVGVKDGKLYSSFTPLSITSNLSVNFSLAETTTADFKAQLDALNQ